MPGHTNVKALLSHLSTPNLILVCLTLQTPQCWKSCLALGRILEDFRSSVHPMGGKSSLAQEIHPGTQSIYSLLVWAAPAESLVLQQLRNEPSLAMPSSELHSKPCLLSIQFALSTTLLLLLKTEPGKAGGRNPRGSYLHPAPNRPPLLRKSSKTH